MFDQYTHRLSLSAVGLYRDTRAVLRGAECEAGAMGLVETEERAAERAGGPPAAGQAFGPLGTGEVLGLEPAEGGGFQGYCHPGRARTRAYGGALIGQALAAAYRTVESGRPVHSLHAYFLRAVDSQRPTHFAPEVLRDGRSYSVRQVRATQEARDALAMTVSFKAPQPAGGLRHPVMPHVPGPEGLPDGWAHRPSRHLLRRSVEYREIPPEPGLGKHEIERFGWFRAIGPLPADPAVHTCAVAYLCDATLSPTALVPYEPTPELRNRPTRHTIASLDHAMWFHAPFRADEWLLYAQRSRVEGDGRALAYGEFWTGDGRLVVSVTQEALLHVRGEA